MARNANLFARAIDNPEDNARGPNSKDNPQVKVGAPKLDGYNDAYATGVTRRMADLRYGGQMGYSPDFTTWVNFHPYVSRNLIPILIEPPLGMRALPNHEVWIAALKSMVETMPMSIQGLNARLDVQTATTPFGGAGQEFEVYTNVRETKPSISMTWKERVGIPVYRFFSAWIRYLMMDPNTKFATINTIAGSELSDLMADQFSMTMLFIEPDELHRYVNQSWLVTNMFPKSTGDNSAKMDRANDGETRDTTIEFSGIAQYGAGVDNFAQTVLDKISIIGADPHGRQAFKTQISDYVKELIGSDYESTAEIIRPQNLILPADARGPAFSERDSDL